MLRNRYYLQLELNYKNHMILALNEDKEDSREIVGYLYLEDFRRAGTPEDFKELHPVYLEDWDDSRNLIVARIITHKKISTEEQEELLILAETFIEFKPAVNHKIEFYVLEELLSLYEKSWEKVVDDIVIQNCIPIYQLLISKFGGNSVVLEELKLDSFNHLYQD